MDVDKMRELLRIKYGICSDEELLDALEKLPALDIGIEAPSLKRQLCKGSEEECGEKLKALSGFMASLLLSAQC